MSLTVRFQVVYQKRRIICLSDIGDLSEYGLGSANNGGGTDGQEFTFPSVSVNQDEYIYVSSNSSGVAGFTTLGLPQITILLLYRLTEMMRLNYLKWNS